MAESGNSTNRISFTQRVKIVYYYQLFTGVCRRLPGNIQQVARRKLRMLNNARALNDLRVRPANRLDALRGRRVGQHSIRVNDQWRICFVWDQGDALSVEIVDYH